MAIEALKCVWHRGAVDADGKTGDGAGIHIQVPQDFFADEVEARPATTLEGGRIGVGKIFLPRTDLAAQEACRTIVESRNPALRLLHLWLAPSAGRHLRHRRKGQRHAARDRTDPVRHRHRERRRGDRARPLHHPPPHRKAGAQGLDPELLRLLALGALADLQGHVPRRAASTFYPDLQRRALRLAGGDLPPALFDQHVPEVAPGPALPHARPQRRDQHAQGQHQLDEEPRDPHGLRSVRRIPATTSSRSSSRAARIRPRSTTCSKSCAAPAAPRRWPRPC